MPICQANPGLFQGKSGEKPASAAICCPCCFQKVSAICGLIRIYVSGNWQKALEYDVSACSRKM